LRANNTSGLHKLKEDELRARIEYLTKLKYEIRNQSAIHGIKNRDLAKYLKISEASLSRFMNKQDTGLKEYRLLAIEKWLAQMKLLPEI